MERHPEAIDPTVLKVIGAAAHDERGPMRSATCTRCARPSARRAQCGIPFDVLMVPTASGHPRFAEVDAEPIAVNSQLGTYTNFVNLLGWCALALPAGIAAGGLPFGVTFIARRAQDAALARFGAAWQASLALTLGATTRAFPADAATIGRAGGLGIAPAVQASLPIAVVGAPSERPAAQSAAAARLGAHSPRGDAQRAALSPLRAARDDAGQARHGACRRRRRRDLARGVVGAERERRCAVGVDRRPARGSAPSSSPMAASCTASCARRTRSRARVDITRHGGWRAYLASLSPTSSGPAPSA